MKFGVREICNVVFRAKEVQKIGNTTFQKGQPVFYIDTAKTSTLEGTADTSYATGGRGNNRLMAWEGNKTMTFTVEDALISEVGLAILSGAELFGENDYKGEAGKEVHVHTIQFDTASKADDAEKGTIVLEIKNIGGEICKTAPIFVMESNPDNEVVSAPLTVEITDNLKGGSGSDKNDIVSYTIASAAFKNGSKYFIDCYVKKPGNKVQEIQITPDKFAGYFYVEADTLFRSQADGKDYPAQITIPNVKIQSAFNFAMSADGDPSTFTFTMDAFPGYTYFEPNKKVLCVIQVINDSAESQVKRIPAMDETGMEVNGDNRTLTDPDDDWFYDSYREGKAPQGNPIVLN